MLKLSQLLFLIWVGMVTALPVSAQSEPDRAATSSPDLETLVDAFQQRRPRREGISRTEEFCAIAPGILGNSDVIWSDRPQFSWRGNADQLTIRNFDTEEIIWSQAIAPLSSGEATTQTAVYAGTPLQPEQVYVWQLANGSDGYSFVFQLMAAADRDRIAGELATLTTNLQATGASAEEIAIAEANYFTTQNLWSDALQRLEEVENPSAAIEQARAAIGADICP